MRHEQLNFNWGLWTCTQASSNCVIGCWVMPFFSVLMCWQSLDTLRKGYARSQTRHSLPFSNSWLCGWVGATQTVSLCNAPCVGWGGCYLSPVVGSAVGLVQLRQSLCVDGGGVLPFSNSWPCGWVGAARTVSLCPPRRVSGRLSSPLPSPVKTWALSHVTPRWL